MLLKSKDDIGPQLAELDELLGLRVSATQREAIERERAMAQAGQRAEREAAFQIDFRLKDHKSWMVIHDLRLEHNGRPAQIDHLIFHPVTWDFYVVETKGIHTKLKIEKGQWCYLQKSHGCGMANPVEQNARHIQVLREVLRDFNWLPRTMGIPVVSRFINVVVVPPECLIRKESEHTWVLHMDELVTKARWDVPWGSLALNLIHWHSGEDAESLGNKLVSLHHPFEINYRERFGIRALAQSRSTGTLAPASQSCESCKGALSKAEASYCRTNRERFAGKMVYQKCQSYVPVENPQPASVEPSPPDPNSDAPRCAKCKRPLTERVNDFCLNNHSLFQGQVFCVPCQQSFKRRAAINGSGLWPA